MYMFVCIYIFVKYKGSNTNSCSHSLSQSQHPSSHFSPSPDHVSFTCSMFCICRSFGLFKKCLYFYVHTYILYSNHLHNNTHEKYMHINDENPFWEHTI